MVLPLLFGMAGSALAGAGALGAMSPLLASALGSGLGAFVETGDPLDALTAGVTGYMGGSMLGGAVNKGVGSLMGTTASTAGPTAANAAQAAQAGLPQLAASAPPVRPDMAGKGFFGNMNFGNMMSPDAITGYTGALAAQASMPMDMSNGGGKSRAKIGKAPGRSLNTPYGNGSSEFNYRVQPNFRYAEGGIVDLAGQMPQGQAPQNSPDAIARAAEMAILGQHPEPDKALGMFLKMFGEPALRQLITRTRQKANAQKDPMSDGLSDSIPAMVDGEQPAALSEGEYVLPSDVVSHLGNGDTSAGAMQLDELVNRVRESRTGDPSAPGAINPQQMMPA